MIPKANIYEESHLDSQGKTGKLAFLRLMPFKCLKSAINYMFKQATIGKILES
jgi:hypothetical protein